MKKYFVYLFLLLLFAPLFGVLSLSAIYAKHTKSALEYSRVQKIEVGVMQNLLQLSPEVVVHLIGVSKKQFVLEEDAKYKFNASIFQKWNDLYQKSSFLIDKISDNQASEFTFIVFLNSLFHSNNQIELVDNVKKIMLNGFYLEFFLSNFLDILTPPPRL